MEEFDNVFNSNPIGPCPAMVLLIGHTSVPFIQRLSYRRNMTKLKTVKAAIVKDDKDIYLKYFNQMQYIILTIFRSVKGQVVNIVKHFYKIRESLNGLKIGKLILKH